MPTNDTSALTRRRHRSTSDPFSDPQHRPPPVPPTKDARHYKLSTAKPVPLPSGADNIVDAVQDTVVVRNRPGRNQTSLPPTSRQPAPGPRSQSQDTVLQAAAAMSKAIGKSHKHKGSQYADVIDRLDYSGVGPTFHHDGPFDACAPSRNRHRTKAPILAWSGGHPEDEAALASRKDTVVSTVDAVPRDLPPAPPYHYKEPYKKKVDALAEAWGMHEPEPFEEFFAGNGDTPDSSIYAGKEGYYGPHTRTSGPPTSQRKELREVHRNYVENESDPEAEAEEELPRSPFRRPLPPPQPIFSGQELADEIPSPTTASPPKRSKSILTRLRKIREGNAPELPPSPTSNDNRPTHRSQQSFLGRFRAREPGSANATSPTEIGFNVPTDQFVYVERVGKPGPDVPSKELPATPLSSGGFAENEHGGYFDDIGPSSPGATGLGRTASRLKKKVGQVVGRNYA